MAVLARIGSDGEGEQRAKIGREQRGEIHRERRGEIHRQQRAEIREQRAESRREQRRETRREQRAKMTTEAISAGVELRSVRHCYKSTVALDDISLAVPPGSTVALIGPDGVGKSTLLALVAGTKRIQQGKVYALGIDLAHRDDRQRTQPRIAYMPQGLGKNLYTALTVHENIDFFARLFGQDRAEREMRIKQLL